MKTTLIISLTVVTLVAGTIFKLMGNKKTVQENVYQRDPGRHVLVQADTAALESLDRSFTYTGTFLPLREVLIMPQVHGEVTGVYFSEGDRVSASKRLVQIDDALLQAQFASAEAAYQIAKRNLERNEGAASGGGISPLQLDSYKLTFKNAESQWKQLARQIELSRIEAPFAGTVTLKDVELGSVVGSSPVARITDLSRMKLEVSIPEKEIAMFNTGEDMEIVTSAYPGQTFSGRIEFVSTRADEAHNYTVKVLVANNRGQELKAGMYGTATLKKSLGTKTITIPRSALLGSVKSPKVFVITNDMATLRDVTTGASNGDRVELVDGIRPGEIVVTGGQINLSEGTKVDVARKS